MKFQQAGEGTRPVGDATFRASWKHYSNFYN